MSDVGKTKHEEVARRKVGAHKKLWTAVIASTAVILAVWAVMLPTQIRRVTASVKQDQGRWSQVGDAPSAVGLQQGLQNMKDQLDQMDSNVQLPEQATADASQQAPAQPQAQLPVLEQHDGAAAQVEALRARLEAETTQQTQQ